MEEHDAVIVGARCAGGTLAIALAERGWDVLLVDRDRLPSDTISTHLIYPNTLARLEKLGVLDRLRSEHTLALAPHRLRGLGHEIVGTFSPVGGHDRLAAPRRRVLDKAIVDTALAEGAQGSFGNRVVELIGSGSEEDPVRGVAMEDGRRIGARWVFGADGRGSVVAAGWGSKSSDPQRGEVAFSYAYWQGIAADGYATLHIKPRRDALPRPGRGRPLHADRQRAAGSGQGKQAGARAQVPGGDPALPRDLRSGDARRGRDGHRGDGRPRVADAAASTARLPARAGRWSGMPATSSTPAPHRGLATRSSRRFTSPRLSRARARASTATSSGATSARLSITTGPSTGAASRSRKWASRSSAAWPPSRTAGQDLRDCLARQIEPSQLMSKERLARWFGAPAAAGPAEELAAG